jgi:hypothetical protein
MGKMDDHVQMGKWENWKFFDVFKNTVVYC